MGRVPKIEADPELRASVAARVVRHASQEVAAAVTAAFPPDRRVGRSAIHTRWRRDRGRRLAPGRPRTRRQARRTHGLVPRRTA